jgi:hypothetical protein
MPDSRTCTCCSVHALEWLETGLAARCRVPAGTRRYSYSLDVLPDAKEDQILMLVSYSAPTESLLRDEMELEVTEDIYNAIVL